MKATGPVCFPKLEHDLDYTGTHVYEVQRETRKYSLFFGIVRGMSSVFSRGIGSHRSTSSFLLFKYALLLGIRCFQTCMQWNQPGSKTLLLKFLGLRLSNVSWRWISPQSYLLKHTCHYISTQVVTTYQSCSPFVRSLMLRSKAIPRTYHLNGFVQSDLHLYEPKQILNEVDLTLSVPDRTITITDLSFAIQHRCQSRISSPTPNQFPPRAQEPYYVLRNWKVCAVVINSFPLLRRSIPYPHHLSERGKGLHTVTPLRQASKPSFSIL